MTMDESAKADQAVSGASAEGAVGQPVPAITRATRVLDSLVRSRHGASLTELAERCSLAKSTASNLLRTMVAEGLVRYDNQTRQYNLGPVLVEYGVAALTRTTVVTEARPFMESLAEQSELACLAIQPMPDGHFTAVAKIESRKDIKITIGVGERFGASAPLLSRLSAAWGTPAPGAPTVDDSVLDRIRAQGYDTAFGEYRPELNVVGFPVFDRDGYPCLFITLLAMGADLTLDEIDQMAAYLVESAIAITTRSGGKVPPGYPTVGTTD
uniref:IclR family transcriptional regulator n=1 Tax=Nocardioides sp. (strain JS1661) TaxID=1517491 RepID=A0A089MV07_NOCS1|nr:IclR family transcriptional regulator [Nocardioides sp. JS1661]